MRNLFDPATVEEVRGRLARMRPDSARQWGRMDPAQALAHCVVGLAMARGECRPPRALMGRLLGRMIKPLALGNDAPFRRSTPTAAEMVVADARDFERERARLHEAIDRFVAAGRAGCSTYPHPFFGRLAPDEWAVLMYKHLDHHLRQFGA